MIPRIIHYCWFGRGEIPEMAMRCIDSWHKFMPDYEYKLWNEDNFDVNQLPYTKEAYDAQKYAFVSDYVRLLALCNEGGVYFDTDVEVLKPFDALLGYKAFAGFEGSKVIPVGTCVMASEAKGEWVKEQLGNYQNRHFIKGDGTLDLTTNVAFITSKMRENGFVQNGLEQDYKDLHVFPMEYFSPRRTTGEYIKTDNTYCDHLGLGTWVDKKKGWKGFVLGLFGCEYRIKFIKLKRKLFG